MQLAQTLDFLSRDIKDVNEWMEEEYNKYFSDYFKNQKVLFDRMKSSDDPITDIELEKILTEIPLELFAVTEQLSKIRVAQEVIKTGIKKKKREFISDDSTGYSETKRKELASSIVIEDELLVSVYGSIAERVERQLSYSKELVMSAKKIWDARKAEVGLNLPEVESRLPEYDFNQ